MLTILQIILPLKGMNLLNRLKFFVESQPIFNIGTFCKSAPASVSEKHETVVLYNVLNSRIRFLILNNVIYFIGFNFPECW